MDDECKNCKYEGWSEQEGPCKRCSRYCDLDDHYEYEEKICCECERPLNDSSREEIAHILGNRIEFTENKCLEIADIIIENFNISKKKDLK